MAGSGRPVASPGTSGPPVAVASTPPVAHATSVTTSVATSVALLIASLPTDSRSHASVAIVAPGPAELLVAAGELLEAGPVEVAGALLGLSPRSGPAIPCSWRWRAPRSRLHHQCHTSLSFTSLCESSLLLAHPGLSHLW